MGFLTVESGSGFDSFADLLDTLFHTVLPSLALIEGGLVSLNERWYVMISR